MSQAGAAAAFVAAMLVALLATYWLLGGYLARTYASDHHLGVERLVYRLVGIDPGAEQRWPRYLRSVLAFSVVSVLGLYLLLRIQRYLPLNLDRPGMRPDLAFNTAASFVTNTNWQAYSGEQTIGHVAQAVGLTVQNFVSPAVGLSVALALIRGLHRDRSETVGNFWVDMVRTLVRVLLPMAVIGAVALIGGGVIDNLRGDETVRTVAGADQVIPGGPVASQEVVKHLGTNGGGFFNANSAHPFENPNPFTNWLQIYLLLAIPFALPRMFGLLVRDRRQGRALAVAMATIALVSVTAGIGLESWHHGTVPTSVGAAAEGKETRFGVPDSAAFAGAATLTSTGAVDSAHDSYTSLGGSVPMINMMLGEVAPGGVGSGLSGFLILALLTVFVAGLMVGRTPEYLGKKVRAREIKFVSLTILVTPAMVLVGTGVAMGLPGERAAMTNTGAHGLSEVLYAFTSASNNNGSAFAGLSSDTTWWNSALGLAMLGGRFLPMIFILGLAGSLGGQRPIPVSGGTLPTHRPLFVGMLIAVTVIVVALTYFPALALGPFAEGFH